MNYIFLGLRELLDADQDTIVSRVRIQVLLNDIGESGESVET
jgi:hypothetical protein